MTELVSGWLCGVNVKIITVYFSPLRADLGPLSVLVRWVGEACVSVVNKDVWRLFPNRVL